MKRLKRIPVEELIVGETYHLDARSGATAEYLGRGEDGGARFNGSRKSLLIYGDVYSTGRVINFYVPTTGLDFFIPEEGDTKLIENQ